MKYFIIAERLSHWFYSKVSCNSYLSISSSFPPFYYYSSCLVSSWTMMSSNLYSAVYLSVEIICTLVFSFRFLVEKLELSFKTSLILFVISATFKLQTSNNLEIGRRLACWKYHNKIITLWKLREIKEHLLAYESNKYLYKC